MEVEQLAHLQDLSITSAIVINCEDCVFMSSLQKLSLVDSNLDTLHDDGIIACIALQSFTYHGTKIGTSDSDDESMYLPFETNTFTRFPPDLSALTQLTDLSLIIDSITMGQFDVSWVYALTRLQTLALNLTRGKVFIWLTHNLSALSNLLSLSLCLPAESTLVVTECVEWHSMQSLQRIEFHAEGLYISPNLLGLFDLKQLRSVSFVSCRPSDEISVEVLKSFLEQYRVGKSVFRLHQTDWELQSLIGS